MSPLKRNWLIIIRRRKRTAFFDTFCAAFPSHVGLLFQLLRLPLRRVLFLSVHRAVFSHAKTSIYPAPLSVQNSVSNLSRANISGILIHSCRGVPFARAYTCGRHGIILFRRYLNSVVALSDEATPSHFIPSRSPSLPFPRTRSRGIAQPIFFRELIEISPQGYEGGNSFYRPPSFALSFHDTNANQDAAFVTYFPHFFPIPLCSGHKSSPAVLSVQGSQTHFPIT